MRLSIDNRQLSIRDVLQHVDRFYRLAHTREHHMVKNTLRYAKRQKAKAQSSKLKAAVMVVGGYHTPGITEKLKEENVSYVVITPRVKELPQENL